MKFFLLALGLLVSHPVFAYSLKDDPKYCGYIIRDADGSIHRNMAELRKFQEIHPCPSTGLTTGYCPYFDIDHIIPLSTAGCDLVVNMQWLPNKIKDCPELWCKDRWERKIQYTPLNVIGYKPICCPSVLITFP